MHIFIFQRPNFLNSKQPIPEKDFRTWKTAVGAGSFSNSLRYPLILVALPVQSDFTGNYSAEAYLRRFQTSMM